MDDPPNAVIVGGALGALLEVDARNCRALSLNKKKRMAILMSTSPISKEIMFAIIPKQAEITIDALR